MSLDRKLSLQTRNLTDASLEYAKVVERKGNGTGSVPDSLFHGLLGQDVFIGGHRFHIVGTIVGIFELSTSERGVILDGVWQIGYDDATGIHEPWYIGDNIRMSEGAVGYMVQPVSAKPREWQGYWAELKARSPVASP